MAEMFTVEPSTKGPLCTAPEKATLPARSDGFSELDPHAASVSATAAPQARFAMPLPTALQSQIKHEVRFQPEKLTRTTVSFRCHVDNPAWFASD
jgi:hypothetical protein